MNVFVERQLSACSSSSSTAFAELVLHLYWPECTLNVAYDVSFDSSHVCVQRAGREVRVRIGGGDDTEPRETLDAAECRVLRAPQHNQVTLVLALVPGASALLRAPLQRSGTSGGELVPPSAVDELRCRACDSALVDGSSFERVLPLPSPGWLELSDMWHCKCSHRHQHDTCASDAAPPRRKLAPIDASARLCLVDVALGTLLVHASCLRRNRVRLVPERTVRHCFGLRTPPELYADNSALECAQCDTVVGYAASLDADVRLFSRRLTARAAPGAALLSLFSLESEVASDLCFHVQQAQQHRFIVHVGDDDVDDSATVALLVLVLDADWLAYQSDADESTATLVLSQCLRSHVKLLYRRHRAGTIDDEFELERWQCKLKAQHLHYDSAACDKLVALLAASNSKRPPSMRQLDQMSVATLKKLEL